MLSGANKSEHLLLMGSGASLSGVQPSFTLHIVHAFITCLKPKMQSKVAKMQFARASLHIYNTSVIGSLLICTLMTAAQGCRCCKSYYDFTYSLLLQDYCEQQGVAVKSAVDAACAAGLSTRSLADRFPGAKVQGLDLSPHFLALAELRRR